METGGWIWQKLGCWQKVVHAPGLGGFWESHVRAFPMAFEQTWAFCTSVLTNCCDFNRQKQPSEEGHARGPNSWRNALDPNKWPNHEIFPLIWISCMRSWFCMSKAGGLSLGTTLWKWNISSDLVFIFQVLALANLLNSSNAKLPSRLSQMALGAQPKPKKNLLGAAIFSS